MLLLLEFELIDEADETLWNPNRDFGKNDLGRLAALSAFNSVGVPSTASCLVSTLAFVAVFAEVGAYERRLVGDFKLAAV